MPTTATLAPMIGRHPQYRDNEGCRYRDRRGNSVQDRTRTTFLRIAKTAERRAWQHEVAGDLADDAAEAAVQAEHEAMETEFAAWLAGEYGGPSGCCPDCDDDDYYYDKPSCSCRRCLIHDDPGGCLHAEDRLWDEAHAALAAHKAAERAARLERYTLDESDLPGYGDGLPMWSELHTAPYASDAYID